ncbi:dihydrolipoamide acetyltransferase family protein [Agromyces aerolatus]|uniref:dihydrolipoamide acetyltransferase family protein n=1 Tax=Agromyces sp. LY-1074 TaxID=3074080 RepID=UPI00285CC27B|nr:MULTISPECIES: dihydrolipoamide acetyltransferase family protein [unclassified Agromyces]MDR5699456.1 dihydrolipoamide acetyltransferase family protein [Agromyces sp. LY-1074]MDR5705752.1 dihydrolipoamide acetyltransferase family protein [Agromyces sp. LY-1358]
MSATTNVQQFRLPDLGEGLTEAALVQWLVAVGDVVTVDQAVAEVETAKSVVELPTPYAGVVTALNGEPGDVIAVGTPVLDIGAEGAASATGSDAGAEGAAGGMTGNVADGVGEDVTELEAYRQEERAGSGSGNVLIGYGTSADASPARRRRRAAGPAGAARPTAGSSVVRPNGSAASALSGLAPSGSAVSASAPSGLAPSGSSLSASAPSTSAPEGSSPLVPSAGTPAELGGGSGSRRVLAVRSPLVRRLARDLGVDLHAVAGSGSDGVITRADVMRAADGAAAGAAAGASAGSGASVVSETSVAAGTSVARPLQVLTREPLSMLRRTVGAKLSASRSEIPEATVWVDVDATELWNLRPRMTRGGAKPPSLTALIARFVVLALGEFPLLASQLTPAADELVTFDGVNLGIAADTERGLMVPHIARADRLSVQELDTELRTLAEAARLGRTAPERLRGSTFTLNNYGSFGVDGSAAIINHPEVAILGIGRIIEKPWVVDGAVVPRRIAQLSLVFDHRVCDGGYAAGFLRHVAGSIEDPLALYAEL